MAEVGQQEEFLSKFKSAEAERRAPCTELDHASYPGIGDNATEGAVVFDRWL
jgi:hypothetical protein